MSINKKVQKVKDAAAAEHQASPAVIQNTSATRSSPSNLVHEAFLKEPGAGFSNTCFLDTYLEGEEVTVIFDVDFSGVYPPPKSGDMFLVAKDVDGAWRCLSYLAPQVGGLGHMRRAKVTQAATSSTTITANLYDSSGVEQLTGNESGVTVYSTVAGGGDLDEALPFLESGLDIMITRLPYNYSGSIEWRWYYVGGLFTASEDCSI